MCTDKFHCLNQCFQIVIHVSNWTFLFFDQVLQMNENIAYRFIQLVVEIVWSQAIETQWQMFV